MNYKPSMTPTTERMAKHKPPQKRLGQSIVAAALSLALLSLTQGCSNKEVVKSEATPLYLPVSLTDKKKPPLFQSDTDLVEYSLELLGMVEQMNNDRQTVREAVDVHNQQVRKVSVIK